MRLGFQRDQEEDDEAIDALAQLDNQLQLDRSPQDVPTRRVELPELRITAGEDYGPDAEESAIEGLANEPLKEPEPIAAREAPSAPLSLSKPAALEDDDFLEGLAPSAQHASPPSVQAREEDDEPGINGWAVLADIVTNQGRGIGKIFEVAGAQKRQHKMDKIAADERQLAHEERAQRYGLGSAEREAATALGNRNAAAREAEIELQRRALDVREGKLAAPGGKPGVPRAVAQDVPPPEPSAETPTPFDPDEVADARLGEPPAPGEAEPGAIDLPGTLPTTKGRVPKVNDVIGAPPADDVPVGPNGKPLTESQRRMRDKDAASLNAVPLTEITDPEAWKAHIGSKTTARSDVEKAVGLFDMADKALARMEALRAKHGIEVLSSAEKAEYSMLQKQVAGAYSEIGKTGVLSKEEFLRYAEEMPGMGFGDDPLGNTMRAIGGLVGEDYDPTLDKLKGTRKATQSAIGSALSPYGIRYTGVRMAPETTGRNAKFRSLSTPVDEPDDEFSRWTR